MFTAEAFLAIAEERYGQAVLRDRMRGGSTTQEKDTELLRVAFSVLGRVQVAASASCGWPLPGVWPSGSVDAADNDISGLAYSDIWPADLLQRALDLFNWRTLAGLEQASDNQRRVGQAAEKYFDSLENGSLSLGLGVPADEKSGTPIAARNRDGSSNVSGVCDQENVLDTFRGRAWNGD